METNPSGARAVDHPASTTRPRRAVVAGMAVAMLLLAALAWHLTALVAYDSSAAPGPAAKRLASAQLAAKMEPWNDRFAWRVVGLRGLTLLAEGHVRQAYFLVYPYMQVVFGRDATFIDIYHRILAAETLMDSGIPHVAHGLDPYNRFDTSNPATPTLGGTPAVQATSP